jgi:opacity protein-like surface antigen
MRPLISVLFLIVVVSVDLAAQTPPRPHRRWEITWTAGASRGASVQEIKAAMSAAGFNSTTPAGCFGGYCWGPVPYPATYAGGPTATLAVSYAFRPGYVLRLQSTSGDLGETLGYHDPWGYVFLRQSVTSVSALFVVNVGGLHAGAGPAIHLPSITRFDAQAGRWRHTKVGMTFHAGLSVPVRSRLFAEVAVQYQLVGSMTAGPFTTADTAATMPRTRTSFSYHTIKLGLGVRI